ncbi:XRE family transcriptional regulator [Roseibium sp.]|uniref:LexA family protein n=1 Tax=Roseibium sp. TaxID=1936156 RepID=UPI001B0273E0|nr:XRE family transcriptional regulator [Roseibium sp.]MBO6858340.1 helix-turn-helix domain-containing protein [Roseibium sp.]
MAVDSLKSIGDRLREARNAAGYGSMSAAAARVGKTQSTYRAHENGQNEYDYEDAQKYAEAFGVTADWLLFGGDAHYGEWLRSKSSRRAKTGAAEPLRIAGEVAAGLWLEADLFESERETASPLIGGDGRFPLDYQYLLTIRGESLNKIARDGDLILCLDYGQSGIEIKTGDLVVVERSRDGGHTIERTAKRIFKDGSQIELRPESTDPRFQEPVIFDEHSEESTQVRVIAKVLWVLKGQ